MMRCKVVCSQKQKFDDGEVLHFAPVYTGSEENKQFFAYTPGGVINFNLTRPEVAAQFEIGKEYYVDMFPAGRSDLIQIPSAHPKADTEADI